MRLKESKNLPFVALEDRDELEKAWDNPKI